MNSNIASVESAVIYSRSLHVLKQFMQIDPFLSTLTWKEKFDQNLSAWEVHGDATPFLQNLGGMGDLNDTPCSIGGPWTRMLYFSVIQTAWESAKAMGESAQKLTAPTLTRTNEDSNLNTALFCPRCKNTFVEAADAHAFARTQWKKFYFVQDLVNLNPKDLINNALKEGLNPLHQQLIHDVKLRFEEAGLKFLRNKEFWLCPQCKIPSLFMRRTHYLVDSIYLVSK